MDKSQIEANKPDGSTNKLYESGAQRSKDAEDTRYDLFHPHPMQRIAVVWANGANKYGAFNHERGFPIWSCLNHCLRHIWKWLSGDRSEDHFAHATCNLFMAMISETYHPQLNAGSTRGPDNSLTEAMIEAMEKHHSKQPQ